jgi:hypothetical protein
MKPVPQSVATGKKDSHCKVSSKSVPSEQAEVSQTRRMKNIQSPLLSAATWE